jgi:hypothetical protein
MNFLGNMSVFGGEQIDREPESGTNGGFVPVGERNGNPFNSVVARFPSMFFEHSIARWTYMCVQQGPGRFKSRADYLYTRENIEVEITYPWNGQTVQVLYDPVYEGKSALAYYRDRMGFRLVLREARASEWVKPDGGYFVTFIAGTGCAKRIIALCKEAGVIMTDAGAAHPYGNDPEDRYIRIAPSFPSLAELGTAMEVFCTAAKLATVERSLS